MATPAPTGYTVDDLDWLRDQLGVAHIELDPWGSIIVTPASDEHEIALARLRGQAGRQLSVPDECIFVNGFAWKVPGGSGYLNVPDLVVLAPGWTRALDLHVTPPPLLVGEVLSPSTQAIDRGRKLADYRLGGAPLYLIVDPEHATFELHDFVAGTASTATSTIDLVVGGQPLRFDLSS